jgi:sodium-dependent multivitamin transporter 6
LKWLCYEFGVPLGLILVMAVIIPELHRGNFISIYEYLEKRFDSSTRTLISILFQIGRGLATAVAVLAGGIILSTALSISTASAIILVGLVTVIYDMLGGISMVILSDVLQMGIIFAGLVLCGGVAGYLIGWDKAWTIFSPERTHILDFSGFGLSQEGTYGFWPMTIGGIFLYVSYYGCDQSQVQRELTVRNVDEVKKSLLVNAFGRFPLVFLYCLVGVFVGALFLYPETLDRIAYVMNSSPEAIKHILDKDPDRMLPIFILSYLPHGMIGFIFVAIMAALMSSLDSGLNSLSAATMVDIYKPFLKPDAGRRHCLIASRVITCFWGLFCIAVALVFADLSEATRQTTLVLINAVGSLLYGPILSAFILGMMTKWARTRAVKIGVVSGIVVNLLLWQFTSISWLWWNAAGFAVSFILAFLLSMSHLIKRVEKVSETSRIPEEKSSINWNFIYFLTVVYFFFIITICYLIEK